MLNNNQQAVGGLAAFFTAKTDTRLAESNGSGPWADVWAARPGFEYSLKPGTSGILMFLTDIKLVPMHKIVTHWVDARGFPGTDWLPSTALELKDGALQPNGSPDIFGDVLGKQPKLVGIAAVLDLNPYTTKDGTKVNWTVRYIIIDNDAVMTALSQVSGMKQRPLKDAYFQVTRTSNPKSSRIGDVWQFNDFTTLDKVRANEGYGDVTDDVYTKIDLDTAFPMVDAETAVRIVSGHARVVDKHENISASHGYNKALLAQAKNGDYSAFDTGSDAPMLSNAMPTAGDPAPGSGLSDLNFDGDGEDPFATDGGVKL